MVHYIDRKRLWKADQSPAIIAPKAMKNVSTFLLLVVLATSAMAATTTLPFIDDNYAKALAEAKQRQLPLFVEASAVW